ncbi:DUF368 domain-containing protein [Roseburia sp. MSJ-14]|nr:DUF368 domain-containing protein [Roseburia sp. MSJ-14]MBU5473846.1 DUF368 domain-containing protein [Roseburia sp. MSJ-14]
MSLADSVPGVSGGTIAFIMGFYDRFIGSLDAMVSGNKEQKKKAAVFLVKLMCGWGIGFCMSVLVIGNLFHTYIYQLCSLFMGLTIFSLPIIFREEKESIIGHYKNVIFALIGVGVVVAITYSNQHIGAGSSVDISALSWKNGIYLFVVAMIAISAMVLPGISGSTLLLIFGLYVPIISGIKEFLHFNFQYVPALFVFGCGVIVGILSVIKLVKLGLERHRSAMIYFILGLMFGSLYAIVMGPTTLDVPQEAMGVKTFHVVFFLLGGVILFALEKLKHIAERTTEVCVTE